MKQQKPIKIYNLMEDEMNIELFCFIEQTGMQDISDLMQGDPDILNIGGKRIHFVEFDTDESKWVVYLNPEPAVRRDRIENILLSFFSEGWEENFELRKQCWEEFKHNCIAYRGSQGIFYEIWKYRKDKNEMIAAGRRLFSSKSTWFNTQNVEVRNLKIAGTKKSAKENSIPDNLTQPPGKAGESFFPVSQGQAPGFEKNHPHYVPVFFPKTLTHLKSSPFAARQLDKVVRPNINN